MIDLIRFFDGNASPNLVKRIEMKRKLNLLFDQEMLEWEQFIQSFESKEGGIDVIHELYEGWYQTILTEKNTPIG